MVTYAGPTVYQRVASVTPWHTLSVGMQDSINGLCEAVEATKIGEAFIVKYMEHMAKAFEPGPRTPHLSRIGYGGLRKICLPMKVMPPAACTRPEMENARKRLSETVGDRPFILSKHLCALALDDLHWLSNQESLPDGPPPVLGAGSVVMHGASVRMPLVILRPVVWHHYDNATFEFSRELAYISTDFKEIKASDIVETLIKTEWPLNRVGVAFVWDGPDKPYYLPAQEMRDQAKMWGIKSSLMLPLATRDCSLLW